MGKVKFRQTRVLSGREARRIGQREAEREKRQADVAAFWALSPEERRKRMADNEAFQRISRNGISIEDLKMAEENGRRDGFATGTEETMRNVYAAICLALHELHGFDADQCRAVLAATDEKVTYALNSSDLLAELKDTLDLEFRFTTELGAEKIREAGA